MPVSVISIHAPRTGSDKRFQALPISGKYFNPRSPHGERQTLSSPPDFRKIFQSTLPARGATSSSASLLPARTSFQSTLPARGATVGKFIKSCEELISIHAPRTGSDLLEHELHNGNADISIHAPRTGSDFFQRLFAPSANVISIHAPRTGSDCFGAITAVRDGISIHAPRTGSDTKHFYNVAGSRKFQSTLPARGATVRIA